MKYHMIRLFSSEPKTRKENLCTVLEFVFLSPEKILFNISSFGVLYFKNIMTTHSKGVAKNDLKSFHREYR